MGHGRRLRLWLGERSWMWAFGVLAAGVGVVAVGVQGGLLAVDVIGLLLATAGLGVIHLRGARWVRGAVGLRRPLTMLAVGLSAAVVGSAITAAASSSNSRLIGVLGTTMLIIGLALVSHAVSFEGDNSLVGFLANAGSVGVPALAVSLILDIPVAVTGAVAALWLTTAYLTRWAESPHFTPFVALAALATVPSITVFLLVDSDDPERLLTVAGLAVAIFFGCIVVFSVWVRARPVETPAASATGPAEATPSASRWFIGSAAVLTAVGGTWLAAVFDGLSLATVAMMMLAMAALGSSFLLRGEGLFVGVAVAALVVWAIGETTLAPPDHVVGSPTGGQTLLVLGDSYSSGEGASVFFSGTNHAGENQCRRAATAYGPRVGAALSWQVVMPACSGAAAQHLFRSGQYPQSPNQLAGSSPQLAVWPTDAVPPTAVVVTIGGNDAMFGDIGAACAVPGSCSGIGNAIADNLPNVAIFVEQALDRVLKRFPATPVVVLPYPEMLNPSANGCSDVPLDRDEYELMKVFVPALNDTIESAVADFEDDRLYWLEDGRSAFEGHRFCEGSSVSPMNTISIAPVDGISLGARLDPRNWLHNSFHPNEFGHELMAAPVIDFFQSGCHQQPASGGCGASVTMSATETDPTLSNEEEATVRSSGGATCTGRHECGDIVAASGIDAVLGEVRRASGGGLVMVAAGWLAARAWLGTRRGETAPRGGTR